MKARPAAVRARAQGPQNLEARAGAQPARSGPQVGSSAESDSKSKSQDRGRTRLSTPVRNGVYMWTVILDL